MAVLWLKFPDEVLFGHRFSADDRKKFEAIFSQGAESPWLQALGRIGLKNPDPSAPLVKWHRESPYFNWSALVATISGGAINPVKAEDGSYKMAVKQTPGGIWALLASQWKIARFLRPDAPRKNDLAESIALGLALQALVMRLGPKVKHMPAWLASPQSAPPAYRKVIAQMQDVQVKRTALSHLWHDIFPAPPSDAAGDDGLPEFFWDDAAPAAAVKKTTNEKPADGVWKGLSVCGGQVTGLAVAVPSSPDAAALDALKAQYNAPLILVFRRARPETTELFGRAAAVLFAEGGVLSHACTVAREQNLPSITALNPAFYDFVKNGGNVWLSIDGTAATAAVLLKPD